MCKIPRVRKDITVFAGKNYCYECLHNLKRKTHKIKTDIVVDFLQVLFANFKIIDTLKKSGYDRLSDEEFNKLLIWVINNYYVSKKNGVQKTPVKKVI